MVCSHADNTMYTHIKVSVTDSHGGRVKKHFMTLVTIFCVLIRTYKFGYKLQVHSSYYHGYGTNTIVAHMSWLANSYVATYRKLCMVVRRMYL